MTYFAQALIQGLTLGALYAQFALGIAVIFGVMRMMNFAYGELIMAGGYAFLIVGASNPIYGVITALVVTAVLALILERIVRPLRTREATAMLVGTFAVSYLLQALATLIFGANPKTGSAGSSLLQTASVGSLSISYLDILTLCSSVVLMVLLTLLLNRTRTGLRLRAVAEDSSMARILGVRMNVVIPVAFVVSGVLAGVAAVLLVAQTGTAQPTLGVNPLLIAFIATILGGLGTFRGAVAGGMLLGLVTAFLSFYLPSSAKPFTSSIGYVAVIVVLVLLPNGLISSRNLRTRV
ncbi:MAG: branched-chain amino acid ABC transporter permease [Actinobacteria bacterium]|nr:branched-chain amino acid ABC transporter permease [Actinomycetota bacterium]